MLNKDTKEILCTNFCNGRKHDFKLLKESKIRLSSNIQVITDTGYQGIKKFIEIVIYQRKKVKNFLYVRKLTPRQNL